MRFSEFEIDIVLDFLRKGGNFSFEENKEYIEEIFFGRLTVEKQNVKVHSLKNLLIFRLLDVAGIDKVERVLDAKIIKVKRFEFPVVSILNRQKSYLVEGKIIYTNKPQEENCFLINNEIIQACKTLRTLFNTKNFILVFNKDKFTGTSFMLSAVVAHFFSENLFKYFMFTGEVLPSGKINKVNSVSEKENLAKTYRKKLVSPEDISCIEELDFWFNKDKLLPVPFTIMIKKDNNALALLETSIKERYPFFSISNLKKFFELQIEDIFIFYPEFLSEDSQEWQNIVQQIKKRFKKIFSLKKLVELKKISINLSCSESAISFATGVLVGTKKKVVFYGYNRKSNSYIPLIETDDALRSLNFSKETLGGKFIEYNYVLNDKKDVLSVIFDMTLSARIEYDVKEFLNEQEIGNFVVINLNRTQIGNVIPEDINIRQKIVNEIYNLLNYPIFKKFKKLWFFMNLPVDIAFGLGSVFQDTREISIFKFFPANSTKYVEVLNVSPQGVKSIF